VATLRGKEGNRDIMENPYKPYEVINHYSFKFTIADDDNNTEVIINTKTQECRLGKNKEDILMMKEVDDKLGKRTYIKHITEFVRNRLYFDVMKNLELSTIQAPDIKLMTDKDVEDYTERCLDE